jgi:hypothetical protein
MKTEYIEREAMRLFRMVHGSGDAGSEFAFHAMNPGLQEGWLRLARTTLKKEITDAVFAPLPQENQFLYEAIDVEPEPQNEKIKQLWVLIEELGRLGVIIGLSHTQKNGYSMKIKFPVRK